MLTDSHAGPAQQGPMIIDGNGDLVWFLPLSPGSDTGLRAFNLHTWSYRGKDVLAWFQGAVVERPRARPLRVVRLQLQEGRPRSTPRTVTRATSTSSWSRPQGTALFTCYGQAPADLSRFGGAKHGTYFYGVVQEVDLSTGKLVFEWRSDDHVSLDQSYQAGVARRAPGTISISIRSTSTPPTASS